MRPSMRWGTRRGHDSGVRTNAPLRVAMPPTIIRLPIGNSLTGEQYTATLNVGSNALPLRFLLDTGSSALAVGGNVYDPAGDQGAKTTNYLQVIYYQSG